MIKTDEQRRWWFANHPEYSRSRKGGTDRKQLEEKKHSDEVRPEDIDAYVDDTLKYIDESEADLLKLAKQYFGTGAYSGIGAQSAGTFPGNMRSVANEILGTGISARNKDVSHSRFRFGEKTPRFGHHENSRLIAAGYHPDGGVFMPGPPTSEEVSRWSQEVVRTFIRGFYKLLQNNPLLIDPNALERHHGLPKEFTDYFKAANVRIEDYVIIITAAKHRLKPDGVHTGKGRGGDWNREWREFIDDNPITNTPKDRKRVEAKLEEMIKKYKLE